MKFTVPCVFIMLFVVCLVKSHSAEAQIYPFKCFVKIDGAKYEKGYLYKMTDSTIQITRKHNDLFKVADQPDLLETIPLNNHVNQIRLRSRFIGAPAAMIGFAAGLTISCLAVMSTDPDLDGAIVGFFIVVPVATVGLSALNAVAVNSTSKVNYKHQISGANELEALKYYSFVNWLDRKKTSR